MQKIITILEKHVQWIVLGVAALFFVWMVYGYWIQQPASVSLGGQTLTAGEVDPHILSNESRKLEEAMNTSKPIKMEVTPFAEQFVAAMSWGNHETPTLAAEKF